MTKDILKLSSTLLGLDDVVEYLNSNQEEAPSEEVSEKINQLLVLTNYILREITKEYYPLSYEEVIFSDSNCQIFYSNFSKRVIAIKDIKNESNLSVTFNLYPEFIKVGCPNAQYFVSYNYTLESIQNINQHLTLPLGLDYFIVCYGIASEYALSKLLYNEAEMWDNKFRNSLERIKSKTGERRFFARRLK